MIRSQWGMCFKFNIIMTLGLAIWARIFQLTGDMTILYPFIQGSLEWPFSELFSSDISLWNQYKYIAFNIFSCRILMVAYKMLIITSTVNIWAILCRNGTIFYRHKTSFFISSGGKTESVQGFKMKLFE